MHNIIDLPTDVVGAADTNPQKEKSAYKAPKVTTVQFKVESGFNSINGINPINTASNGEPSNAWQSNSNDGTQTYFDTRSF